MTLVIALIIKAAQHVPSVHHQGQKIPSPRANFHMELTSTLPARVVTSRFIEQVQ